MGFFSSLKEAFQTGGEFVTKEVAAKTNEVGRKRIQMIEDMRQQGYILVDELMQACSIPGIFGSSDGVCYTMTFQRDPEYVKAKQEEAERQREQAAAEEKRQRKRRDLQSQLHDEYRKKLGEGYCLQLECSKTDIKSIVAELNCAVDFIVDELDVHDAFLVEDYFKIMPKILKQTGSYYLMSDYGEDACKIVQKMLEDNDITTDLIPYNREDCREQEKLCMKKNLYDCDFFDSMINHTLWTTVENLTELLDNCENQDTILSELKDEMYMTPLYLKLLGKN